MIRKTTYILILTFIFSCNGKRHENVKESDFIGLWHSIKRDIPYSATLQINKDKTFEFKYNACMLHGSSVGEWNLNDTIIILNSNSFDTCTLTEGFGNNCTEVKFDTSLNEPTNKKDCVQNDTYYIIFDNSKFMIRNDSLIYESKKKNLCPEIKDIFVKR